MRGKHRDAAAHALGVLDDPAEFETHLRDCARCRVAVDGFRSVGDALAAADRLGYLPRGGSSGPGYPLPGGGPAGGADRFASAASIVSPARVVAGTGGAPRDLPWSAGFQ
ncbi:hypothetical protein [Amycolatopsis sp. SID8362]|uniref:hypothetical protein n=1 Tax=Amycolatopsis sp. SID8362 TaxID=2690346 RepID=UPI00136ED9C9|nr:hypothetical protein [Amycolatopsis sp. SID8362]NBH09056.1 hypothetical protein [Amycolatopsis sp. SID8362]NED45748.1 hypothetical protein [Amycolatopsis sp. SID8362]